MASFDSSLPCSTATPPPPPPRPSTQPSTAFAPPLPPPPPRTSSRSEWQSQQQALGQQGSGTPAGQGYPPQQPPPHQDPAQYLPPEGWLPQLLLDKSKPDLANALSSPALLTALLHDPTSPLPSLAASEIPLTTLLSQNEILATTLLNLLATLTHVRATVSTHLLSARALERQWKNKQTELESALEAFGPRVLYRRLGEEVAEEEARCRAVEESFLERDAGVVGEREVGEWVRRVREGRRLVCLRRERRARWDEGRVGGWR